MSEHFGRFALDAIRDLNLDGLFTLHGRASICIALHLAGVRSVWSRTSRYIETNLICLFVDVIGERLRPNS